MDCIVKMRTVLCIHLKNTKDRESVWFFMFEYKNKVAKTRRCLEGGELNL